MSDEKEEDNSSEYGEKELSQLDEILSFPGKVETQREKPIEEGKLGVLKDYGHEGLFQTIADEMVAEAEREGQDELWRVNQLVDEEFIEGMLTDNVNPRIWEIRWRCTRCVTRRVSPDEQGLWTMKTCPCAMHLCASCMKVALWVAESKPEWFCPFGCDPTTEGFRYHEISRYVLILVPYPKILKDGLRSLGKGRLEASQDKTVEIRGANFNRLRVYELREEAKETVVVHRLSERQMRMEILAEDRAELISVMRSTQRDKMLAKLAAQHEVDEYLRLRGLEEMFSKASSTSESRNNGSGGDTDDEDDDDDGRDEASQAVDQAENNEMGQDSGATQDKTRNQDLERSVADGRMEYVQLPGGEVIDGEQPGSRRRHSTGTGIVENEQSQQEKGIKQPGLKFIRVSVIVHGSTERTARLPMYLREEKTCKESDGDENGGEDQDAGYLSDLESVKNGNQRVQAPTKPLIGNEESLVDVTKKLRPRKIRCNVCDIEFTTEETRDAHERRGLHEYDPTGQEMNNPIINDSRKRSLRKWNLLEKKTLNMAEETPPLVLECDHCEFVTKHPKSMRGHRMVLCARRLARRKKEGKNAKCHKCDYCRFQTLYRYNLTSHLRVGCRRKPKD